MTATGRLDPPAVKPPVIAYRSADPVSGPIQVKTTPLPLGDAANPCGAPGVPADTPSPTVSRKLVFEDCDPSLADTVMIASPDRPSAPVTLRLNWPPPSRVICNAATGTSVVSDEEVETRTASAIIPALTVKLTETDPLTAIA